MIYTLLDARNHVSKFVESGTCPSKQVVLDRINEACRRLMAKANWAYTTTRMRFVTSNNTFALPRGALAVLNCNIDLSPRRVFGVGYEFLENGPGEVQYGEGYTKALTDLGDGWPTFFELPPGVPCNLIAFCTAREDIGKQLLLRGLDAQKQDVLTAGVPGEYLTAGWWQNGIEGQVSVNNLPTISTTQFTHIQFVQKPVTIGYISLYTWDAATKRMYFLAKYHPAETAPGYRRYRITAPDFENGSNVLCSVKMRFENLVSDTDPLPIQSVDAIKQAVIAIREENDRNDQQAKVAWTQALALLNDQLVDTRENGDLQLQMVDQFALGSVANII